MSLRAVLSCLLLPLATQAVAQPGPSDPFRAEVASIVASDPRIAEGRAGYREARAGVGEARQLLMPTGDASLTRTRTLARGFSNDRNAIIERSRPVLRTDALLQVEQTLVDFGTGAGRLQAARARAEAALAGIGDNATQVALGAVQTIADVVAYRRLVKLCDAQIARQWRLRDELVQRLAAGVSAPADLAQIDGAIAETTARHAGYVRALASAEARHLALAGTRLPEGIVVTVPRGSPAPGVLPGVAAAQAGARAARADAKSARGAALPRLTVGVSAGRYGVFETDRDYDVRGNVTLRVPLLGGLAQRAEAAEARADAAAARADRVRIEAERDAGIAANDVIALEREVAALDANLTATTRARDVIAERFAVQRGTLLDRLSAEERVAQVEARVVEAGSELLLARYVRLARGGILLAELGLEPTMGANR